MVCPKCKVSTLVRRRGNAEVTVCRNKRCKNFNNTVTVLRVIPTPEAVEPEAVTEMGEAEKED